MLGGFINVCVCVCVCVEGDSEDEGVLYSGGLQSSAD